MLDASTKRYMSHNLISVAWTETMQAAFDKMSSHRIRHLPVVSETQEVVGIISDRDFQRAMQIDEPDFFSGRVPQAAFSPHARVRDFMCSPIQTLSVESSLSEAAKVMLDKKISALLIANEAEIVGILTTDDLLRALIESLEQTSEVPFKDRFLSVLFDSPTQPNL